MPEYKKVVMPEGFYPASPDFLSVRAHPLRKQKREIPALHNIKKRTKQNCFVRFKTSSKQPILIFQALQG